MTRARAIHVESPAFRHGERIGVEHTGDGRDVSPPLSWSGVPQGTKEIALIMDDPDAPRPEPFVHWVIYGIPPAAPGLPEGVATAHHPPEPAGAVQGKNSFGTTGYRGPAPPPGHGTHHYHFRVYASDAALNLGPGAMKADVLRALEGHIIGEGELVGTYSRE